MTHDEHESKLRERVAKLETDVEYMKESIDRIEKQVSNDLPHAIADVKMSVEKLGRHYNDLDAITKFAGLLLKILATIAALGWTLKNLFKW